VNYEHLSVVGVADSIVQQCKEISTRRTTSDGRDEFCLESFQLWLHNG